MKTVAETKLLFVTIYIWVLCLNMVVVVVRSKKGNYELSDLE